MTRHPDRQTGLRPKTSAGTAGIPALAAALCGVALLSACASEAPPAASGPVASAAPSAASPAASTAARNDRMMWPAPQQAGQEPDGVEQTQVGSLKSGGILRVVAARGDLSGQRELGWVAGGVERYKNAACSQRFQLGNAPKPSRKPNLLLCWRTTPTKSVIAVVVDPKGKPSKAKAVRELEKKWQAMG